MKATALLFAALTSACTLDAGQGFSTLESVELEAHFEPGVEREVEGGVLTDLGYVVRFEAIGVELSQLELATFGGESAEPPGNEHEHCHDEACESEDASEHDAGVATLVARLPVDRSVDMLEGDRLVLTRVEPSRELGEMHLERAELHVARLQLSAVASEGGLAGDVPISVDMELDAHVTARMDVAVTHDGPEHLTLHGALVLEGPLFDGIDFSTEARFDLHDEHELAAPVRGELLDALHLSLAEEARP